MMNQVKHGLSFILGGMYASIIWMLILGWSMDIESWVLATATVFSTTLIFVFIGKFFVTHWRKR